MKKILFGLLSLLIVSSLYAGKGKVRIAADKEGAYIYVDGKKKAMTGEGFTSVLLEEGEHTIKVAKPKDKYYEYSAQKKVFVGEDTSTKLKFELEEVIRSEVKAKWEAELEAYKKTIPQRDVEKHKRWVRKGQVVVDKKLGLVWQDNNAAVSTKKNWQDAKKYCQNLRVDGYSNWRLPNYNELLTIVDYDRYNPALIPAFKYRNNWSYWTSDKVNKKGWNDYVYTVRFYNGRGEHSGNCDKCIKQVRCITLQQKN